MVEEVEAERAKVKEGGNEAPVLLAVSMWGGVRVGVDMPGSV